MLRLFVHLMDADDVELRNSATFGVANFSSAVENHQQLVEEDCLPRLTRLVATDDPEAQLRAVAALRGLAVDANLRPEIVDKVGVLVVVLWGRRGGGHA